MTIEELTAMDQNSVLDLDVSWIDDEFGKGLAEEIADCNSALSLVHLKELVERKLAAIGSDWLDEITLS